MYINSVGNVHNKMWMFFFVIPFHLKVFACGSFSFPAKTI